MKKRELKIATLALVLVSGLLFFLDQENRIGSSQFPVIDVHLHTDFSGELEVGSDIPYSYEQLLSELKQAGVVGGVSHSSNGQDPGPDLRSQGLVHCSGIKENYDLKDLRSSLESERFACIKIYLGYVHQYAASEFYSPIYQLARKMDVPVVFHTGDTDSSRAKLKYAHPLSIDEVAVDHPNINFVIAHMGNPWTRDAAEVAYKNPNVYIEASALSIGDVSTFPKQDLQRYLIDPIAWAFGYIENPKKFLFGSDWPLVAIKPYIEVYKRAIPRQHWEDVFYNNAVRIFKLEGKTKKPLNIANSSSED